uniref:Transposase IS200-like domain-containing protein n=1 Tax=Romanomermis culicivorax TaxID=13658 RepID=A0A915L3A4_ROMCU
MHFQVQIQAFFDKSPQRFYMDVRSVENRGEIFVYVIRTNASLENRLLHCIKKLKQQYFNIVVGALNIIDHVHLASTVWEVMMPVIKQGMKGGKEILYPCSTKPFMFGEICSHFYISLPYQQLKLLIIFMNKSDNY